MKTDELIDTLAMSVEPVTPARPSALWLAAAAGASFATVTLDLGAGLVSAAMWLKIAYTLGVAGAGVWLAQRFGSPGADPRHAVWTMLALVVLAVGWQTHPAPREPTGARRA